MLGNRRRRMLLASAAVVIIAVFGWRLTRQPSAVQVVSPERREVVEFVVASGKLRAVRQSDVGAELSGIVEGVNVDEGDAVDVGLVLITLERREAERQVEQARLAAETAAAELERVRSGPLEEDIARARAQLDLADGVGRARTERALQSLRDLQRGGREEERERAEAALAEAAAIREQASRDFRRGQQLVAEGAISQEQADRAETDLERAISAEQRARQDLALAREPASPEEIAAAEADLAAAQADWNGSVLVARETLNALLSQPRPEDVRVAEARLREAENALRLAEENLSKRIIRAPVAGLITMRQVEPGQSVTPSQRLLTVADMNRTEIYVETDENNLGKLDVGQRAFLVSPAYLAEPFEGTLTQIGPEVDYDRGVVGLRITPDSLPEFARPDMTIDVNVEVARLADALAVPETAVIETDVHSYVVVAEDGVARRRETRIFGRSAEYVAVRGLSEDAWVVLRATEVEDGEPIRPVRTRP